MVPYPKIETLFDRDNKFKVVVGNYRNQAFSQIDEWDVYEKIHGTNIRVMAGPLDIDNSNPITDRDLLDPQVWYNGRTDNAHLQPEVVSHLSKVYTVKSVLYAVRKAKGAQGVVIYMEAYGPKIQEGGNYRNDVSSRIFDVFVIDENGPAPASSDGVEPGVNGWWLEQLAVASIAKDLGVETVPFIGRMRIDEIVNYVRTGHPSVIPMLEKPIMSKYTEYQMEGVVARSNPQLFDKKGSRVLWKLKTRDF